MTKLPDVGLTLRRTFNYSGRATRVEFWLWMPAFVIVQAVIWGVDWPVGSGFPPYVVPLMQLVGLLLFLPTLSVTVRRLHDTGRSGWWILLWTVLPMPFWAWLGWLAYEELGAGLVTGDSSVEPSTYFVLALAVGCNALVLVWAIRWLALPGDGDSNWYGAREWPQVAGKDKSAVARWCGFPPSRE